LIDKDVVFTGVRDQGKADSGKIRNWIKNKSKKPYSEVDQPEKC
jgi:hypothetical protein